MANVGDRISAVRVAALQPAEDLADQLVAASRNRCYLDCRIGDGRGPIDSGRLRDALLKRRTELDPFGIRLVAAEVQAGLDLRGVSFPAPLLGVGRLLRRPPRLTLPGCGGVTRAPRCGPGRRHRFCRSTWMPRWY